MRDHDLEGDPAPADIQAGEYVLGVLDADALRDARRRIARDPAFARLVDAWSARLAPLDDELAAPDVPAHLWPRIRAQLGWSPVQPLDGGLQRKVAFWRGSAAAGFAMAATLAAVVVMRAGVHDARPASGGTDVPVDSTAAKPAAPMPQMPVTQLVNDAGTPTYLATIDPRGGGMWLVPVPGGSAPGTRAPVLWLIPAGQAPRALGFVDARRSHWVDVPAELRAAIGSGAVLAITFEPVAATPPAAPTSTPVATGGITL